MLTVKLHTVSRKFTLKHVSRDVTFKHVGSRGLSAYQVAVQNGFVGTEEEWLESLQSELSQQALALKVNISDIVDTLNSTAANKPLSANQGRILKGLIDALSAILVSDDTSLNTLQEIVDYIKENRDDLENLSIASIAGLSAALASKVAKGELVVNVMDYVTVVDGVTDNTQAFINAFAAGKTIIIPKQTQPYLVKYFAPPANKHIIGVGIPQINIQRNGATAISVVRSNSIVEGLYLNSLDADLQFNRIGIESVSNVIVRDCKIEGFRHVSVAPDAWGIFIDKSSKVLIDNCVFENNSQSDIAIVDSCTDIVIDRCSGSNFVIDLEPNNTLIDSNIVISNARIATLMLLENNFLVHTIDNLTVSNCVIDKVLYRGANVSFNDTIISSIVTNASYGGKIGNVNSFGYGKNLNPDPSFHKIVNVTGADYKANWGFVYTPDGNVMDFKEGTTKGKYLQLNPNGIDTTVSIARTFTVTASTLYSIRSLFNIYYPTGSGASNTFKLEYYDITDTIIGSSVNFCVDRKDGYDGTESAWDEKALFFTTPALCTSVKVYIGNASSGSTSTHKLNIKYMLLNRVLLDSRNKMLDDFNSYDATGPYTSILLPTGTGGQNQSLAGQKIYSTNPGTLAFDGWVCVASGNPGIWRTMSSNDYGSFYNSATVDPLNYERLRLFWSSNIAHLQTEKLGTGSTRALQLGNVSQLTLVDNASPALSYTRTATTDTSAAQIRFTHGGLGAASGTQIMHQIALTVTQSSTAGYTASDVNVTETSTGSGTRLLQNWRVGGLSKASVDRLGNISGLNLSGTNTGDQTAATVPNTPAGNIAATDMQSAVNELDSEKVAKSGDTMTGALQLPSVALNSTVTGIASTATTGLARFAGGTNGDGGVILLGGSTNSSIPNQGILRISAANILTWSTTGLEVADAKNIVISTTTGTKIATSASQKLSFWNATPIVQPTTSVTAATRVGGGGTALTDTDTFDGYTLAKVVKALRNTGILA